MHVYSEWFDGLNLIKSLTSQSPYHPLSSTEEQNNISGGNDSGGAGQMVQNKHPSAVTSHTNPLAISSSAEGTMTTQETAELVYSLTQIGTMIKLLDLTGERVEVPKSVHPSIFSSSFPPLYLPISMF
jgi:hypothetical protein